MQSDKQYISSDLIIQTLEKSGLPTLGISTAGPCIHCMSSAKSGQMRVKREETVLTAL